MSWIVMDTSFITHKFIQEKTKHFLEDGGQIVTLPPQEYFGRPWIDQFGERIESVIEKEIC